MRVKIQPNLGIGFVESACFFEELCVGLSIYTLFECLKACFSLFGINEGLCLCLIGVRIGNLVRIGDLVIDTADICPNILICMPFTENQIGINEHYLKGVHKCTLAVCYNN